MNPHYPLVARRAGHRCEYCRAPEAVFNFPFEVERLATGRSICCRQACARMKRFKLFLGNDLRS